MDYFDRLGAALDDAWNEHDRHEERFPDAALAVLARMPPRQAFDRTALLDHLLDPRRPVPEQLAPLGAFGQPGFTVHHGRGFVIEIYHWLESLSAIHNHPFCGAFVILDGFSVHARYAVGPRRALGGRAWHAPMRLAGLDLLEAGDVVPFSLERHPLIHALVHVPVSSISMVVRTVRTEGYLRFLPPSLVLPMAEEDPPRARQLALLEALASAGDPSHEARALALLDRAEFELALRVLSSWWPMLDEDRRRALIDRLRPRLADAAEPLPLVLDQALRLRDATAVREHLRAPELRLVATALGYAEVRAQVLDLLRARKLDPLATLHRFVDEADLFDEGEEASAIIAHTMVDGLTLADAIDRLRDAYGAEAVASHEQEVAAYWRSSLFAPLARTTLDDGDAVIS